MKKLIVIFQSTHNAIQAERLCLKAAVACQVIPLPREISSDCGIALEINNADKKRVGQLLAHHAIHSEFRSLVKPA